MLKENQNMPHSINTAGTCYTALHHVTLHYTMLHYITPCYTALHHVTLHYTMLHYITPCYTTLHYITPCYTTLHHVTLHYIHYTDLAALEQSDMLLNHTIIVFPHKALSLILHSASIVVDLEGRGGCAGFGKMAILPLMSVV